MSRPDDSSRPLSNCDSTYPDEPAQGDGEDDDDWRDAGVELYDRSSFCALALTERYGVTIAVVVGDRLSWHSRGPTPGRALEALKAAKCELIDLLVRIHLDAAGSLAGDDLLIELQGAGFAVRRYGANAALDNAFGGVLHRVPAASLLYTFRRQAGRI